jgi:ABC-type bacteriocin/lantibiotic exporter with double-glycine peptidase domain
LCILIYVICCTICCTFIYFEETEKKTKRGCNINKRQKELLVEFLQNHSDLLKGKFTSTFTHRKAKQLWEEIAYQLNEIPNGANKSWDQWRKVSR